MGDTSSCDTKTIFVPPDTMQFLDGVKYVHYATYVNKLFWPNQSWIQWLRSAWVEWIPFFCLNFTFSIPHNKKTVRWLEMSVKETTNTAGILNFISVDFIKKWLHQSIQFVWARKS
jgi:hypothetical protein